MKKKNIIFIVLAVLPFLLFLTYMGNPTIVDSSSKKNKEYAEKIEQYLIPDISSPSKWQLQILWDSEMFFAKYDVDDELINRLKSVGKYVEIPYEELDTIMINSKGMAPLWWNPDIDSHSYAFAINKNGYLIISTNGFFFVKFILN